MGKVTWLAAGLICASLITYSSLTGTRFSLPELPSSWRRAHPGSQFASAPVWYPGMIGPTGATVQQFVDWFDRHGMQNSWERSDNKQSWILRVDVFNELTNVRSESAMRLEWVADAAQYGSPGPAVMVLQFVEDGYVYSDYEAMAQLGLIAGDIRQGKAQ